MKLILKKQPLNRKGKTGKYENGKTILSQR